MLVRVCSDFGACASIGTVSAENIVAIVNKCDRITFWKLDNCNKTFGQSIKWESNTLERADLYRGDIRIPRAWGKGCCEIVINPRTPAVLGACIRVFGDTSF